MEERKAAFLKAAKGVCVATGATLLCMVLLALAVVFLRISDNALFLMNQLAKVASIFAGAYFAVGPGGQRGFVTGAAVGFVYMVLGYSVYWAFHGSVSAPLVAGTGAVLRRRKRIKQLVKKVFLTSWWTGE